VRAALLLGEFLNVAVRGADRLRRFGPQ
jgi:hypothetical protein